MKDYLARFLSEFQTPGSSLLGQPTELTKGDSVSFVGNSDEAFANSYASPKLPAELKWRVEGMRNLLPEPGKPIPLLVARESAEPKRGECFSCAEPLPPAQPDHLQALCELCRAAKQIVLGLEPASTFIN
jgi:hypothetical protein